MKNLYKVISLYCFIKIEKQSLLTFRNTLFGIVNDDLSGLIILAEEGINGTICGEEEIINKALKLIKTFVGNNDLNEKISFSDRKVFKRLKIRIKPEIVTMGINDINPAIDSGKYVNPTDWNKLLKDQNTLIIDTRNNYEVSLGSFRNSINPNTKNFREFPKWIDKDLAKYINKNKTTKIAMFCTGGIRCEKATSLLKKKGFDNVYHLKGGILKYLENVPSSENLYEGECYVFDERVALDNQLKKGSFSICHACGMPVSSEDKEKKYYIEGIQCKLCINKFTDNDRKRFAERQNQIDERKNKIKISVNKKY